MVVERIVVVETVAFGFCLGFVVFGLGFVFVLGFLVVVVVGENNDTIFLRIGRFSKNPGATVVVFAILFFFFVVTTTFVVVVGRNVVVVVVSVVTTEEELLASVEGLSGVAEEGKGSSVVSTSDSGAEEEVERSDEREEAKRLRTEKVLVGVSS